MDESALRDALANARQELLRSWDRGAFRGFLSSSALSTATASMAFALSAQAAAGTDHQRLAARGHAWLCESQNQDGGWGDTTDSPTNISTTMLCWATLGLAVDRSATSGAIARAEEWLTKECGSLAPEQLARTIRACYGEDHTFSVPILTTCALGGRLGDARDGWRLVPGLPFELAACPHQWFNWLRLQTVSYALPALIAIGQARHHHRPTRNPVLRLLRNLTRKRTLRILRSIQPESGGYLEAAPLTSFVSMSLLSMGLHEHPVTVRALGFLADTVRDDGSWPIDTNLDTWVTTLSINALGNQPPLEAERCASTRDWLLAQQYTEEHPYTHAAPGGWAWTDLSGGVPDADDTSGALLALHRLNGGSDVDAARGGITWLLGVQNRNGGIPTFCRGWGKLPFDQSSPDLTAHALRAWAAWRDELPPRLRDRTDRAKETAVRYLIGTQRKDGAWVPLWFGNQNESRHENPLYGTSRVLRAVASVTCDAQLDGTWVTAGHSAMKWILSAQGFDGGFGGGNGVRPSVEETALALEALAEWALAAERLGTRESEHREALYTGIENAASWLIEKTECGTRFETSPIGLYFAKLWYWERLYPVIFTVSGLESARRCLDVPSSAVTSG